MNDNQEWKVFKVTKGSAIPVDYRWTARNSVFYRASATYSTNGKLNTYKVKFTFSIVTGGLGYWRVDPISNESEPIYACGALAKDTSFKDDKAFDELMSADRSLYFDIMKQSILEHLQKKASEVTFKFKLLDYEMIYRKPVEEQLSLF